MANGKDLVTTIFAGIGAVAVVVSGIRLYGKKKFYEGRKSYEEECGPHPKKEAYKKMIGERKDKK